MSMNYDLRGVAPSAQGASSSLVRADSAETGTVQTGRGSGVMADPQQVGTDAEVGAEVLAPQVGQTYVVFFMGCSLRRV